MFAWISGNALNRSISDCLNPVLPSPIEGFSLAKYFSMADKSCLLNISSTNDLIKSFWLDREDIRHLYVVNNEFIGYSDWKSKVASGKIGLRGPQNSAESLLMALLFQQQKKISRRYYDL
jgi:hypothetical protein